MINGPHTNNNLKEKGGTKAPKNRETIMTHTNMLTKVSPPLQLPHEDHPSLLETPPPYSTHQPEEESSLIPTTCHLRGDGNSNRVKVQPQYGVTNRSSDESLPHHKHQLEEVPSLLPTACKLTGK